MRRSTLSRMAALPLAALLALGCASSSGTQQPQTTAKPEGTGSDFRESPEVDEVEVVEVPELATVYFDFDKSDIRTDARPILKADAEAIRKNPSWGVITLEGNTDERGSEEYNLALGERRARSVRNYLVDLGVPGSRLETISFGEAKPAAMGHDESAWRWNRRVDFSSSK